MRSYDVVKKRQDLTGLCWDERTVTTGTAGTFLKARKQNSLGDIYYKLSCYDSHRGIYGHESVNEVIASRLLDMLNIPHVRYRLIHAEVLVNDEHFITWLSESKDYRSSRERRQAFDVFYGLYKEKKETPLDFCKRFGWENRVKQMIAFDYLIGNRDRHGANIEVTYAQDGSASLSPLFDHGISLIFSSYDNRESVKQFECSRDIQANNFVGSRSLYENLEFVPPHTLEFDEKLFQREIILANLDDAISPGHLDKIWEFLNTRMNVLLEKNIAIAL